MAEPGSFPSPHIIPSTSTHTHTIILLHGRGSNGPEFADEIFQGETSSGKNLPQHLPGVRWVFPSARPSFSTVFQEDLDEWFDIYSLTDPSAEEDLQIDGLKYSVMFIHGLIKSEIEVLGPAGQDRLILGGISQGCAAGITALLTGVCGLSAFVGFNGWMPLRSRVREVIHQTVATDIASWRRMCDHLSASLRSRLGLEGETSRQESVAGGPSAISGAGHTHTPIFLSHSKDDGVVDVTLGRGMRDILNGTGLYQVVWKVYETGGHWIPAPEGFEDLVEFLTKIIRNSTVRRESQSAEN